MGTHRATDPTAGPLPGHLSLHSGVKGQDGALQCKRAQTGENKHCQSHHTFKDMHLVYFSHVN